MPFFGSRSSCSSDQYCCCNNGSGNNCNRSIEHRKRGRRRSRGNLASFASLLLLCASLSCMETASPFTTTHPHSTTPASVVRWNMGSHLLHSSSTQSADSQKKVVILDTSSVDEQISQLKERQRTTHPPSPAREKKRPYDKSSNKRPNNNNKRPHTQQYRGSVSSRCSRPSKSQTTHTLPLLQGTVARKTWHVARILRDIGGYIGN